MRQLAQFIRLTRFLAALEPCDGTSVEIWRDASGDLVRIDITTPDMSL